MTASTTSSSTAFPFASAFQGYAEAFGKMMPAMPEMPGMDAFKTVGTDMAAHGRANLEAVTTSAQVTLKGTSDVLALMAGSTRAGIERTLELTKALAGAGSLQAAVELQAEFARTGMEAFMKDAGELATLASTTAKDSVKPLTERAAAVMAAMQGAGETVAAEVAAKAKPAKAA